MQTNTTHSAGIERLRTLYAFMCGVPGEKVDLNSWRGGVGKKDDGNLLHACGTVGCAVGWACAYPEFQAQGLSWDNYTPTFKYGDGSGVLRSWDAVEEFFGLTFDEATQLFECFRGNTHYADDNWVFYTAEVSDKRLILMRIRNYLHQEGVITAERVEELKAQEDRL